MKVASWNVEGRLTLVTKKRRGTPAKILEMIRRIDADVLILPEAYIGHPAPGVDADLRKMGYTWRDARYEERDDEHTNDNYIRVLSKYEILESISLRWGDIRGLLSVEIKDPASGQIVRFIATHLDERSDDRRYMQLKDAIDFINSSTVPTVMLGDFNAMHYDQRSKFIRNRMIQNISSRIPHEETRGRGAMLTEMASGNSLKFLESKTNLRDVDLRHQPTTTPKLKGAEWMPNIRIAQIDHIFVSPDIESENFKVARDGGADHRAISVNISIK